MIRAQGLAARDKYSSVVRGQRSVIYRLDATSGFIEVSAPSRLRARRDEHLPPARVSTSLPRRAESVPLRATYRITVGLAAHVVRMLGVVIVERLRLHAA